MKKFNLIKRLFMDSHEKQTPQRFGRYAAILIMLLTLGVGQTWANYAYLDLTGFTGWAGDGAWFRMTFGSTNCDSRTEIATNVWRFNIGDNSGSCTYKRMQPNTETQWNYYNGSISSSQNVARISGWNESGSMQTSFVINYIHGTNYIYFDNSVSNFPNNIYFVIGHDYSYSGSSSKYSKAYKMTQVTNTKLYYVKVTDEWKDATYYAVIADDAASISAGSWGSGDLGTTDKGDKGYTAAYKTVYNMEGGSFMLKAASAGNNKALSIDYVSGYGSIQQYTSYSKVKKRDTGTTYTTITSGTWPATINMTGRYMSNNGTSGYSTASTNTGASGSYSNVVTALVEMAYSSLSSSYYFEGWGGNVSAPTITTATHSYNITANTTTFAFFSKKYTLSYDLKGTYGSSSLDVSIADFSGTKTSGSSIPTGHTITFTASPATGYEILGWYSDASCTSAYSSGSGGVTISADKTTFTLSSLNANSGVYCKLAEKTYSLTFSHNGHGSISVGGSTVSSGSTASVNYYTTKALVATPNTGYDFTGWTKSGTNTDKVTIADMTSSGATTTIKATATGTTVTAGFSPITYNITYNQNGGTGASNSTYDIEDDDITLPDGNDMSKDGYNFAGWYDNSGLTGDAITTIPSGSYGDKTFWAKWVDATVYYDITTGVVGHGSISADPDDASLVAGTDIEFTATPDDYYEVEAWYTNAACTEGRHSAGQTTYTLIGLDDDAVVYVKFQPITYTISYTLNGGSNHGSNPDSYNYESSAITLQDPSRSGYTFGGWYTESTFENRVYSIAAKSNGNKAFWAKWTANPYTITLNNHDATTAGTTSISVTFDAATNLTGTPAITVPKKDSYTFGGYYTGEGGTGVQVIAASGNVVASASGGGNTYTSSTKQWKYAGDITLHAKWTERSHKKVYFAKPADWTHVYAYVWNSSNESQKNANWPGKQLDGSVAGTGTEVINCATYYYYKYYTDGGSDDGEGLVGNSAWNRVIFNNGDNPGVANNTKTSNLTITNGYAYGVHTGMQSTSASGYATSAKWTLRGSFNSWSSSTYPFSCAEGEHSYSVLVEGLTASTNYSFKIWGPDGVAYKYTGGKDESYNPDYSVTSLLDGRDLVLNEYASNNNTFTTATTSYLFTLDVTDPKHPVLTIVPGDDADYSVTMAVSGHGKITTPGTGSKTIHRYAPTTITAVADPGYRFTGWTVDGAHSSYVTFGNASSLSTNVTGVDGAAGATITANFSNDGFVYFDASAVSGFSGGGKVYVTYLQSSDLSWDDGEGGTGALIVKNWISDALHNQEMTRIPNTNIYYFYTSTTPQGKILFTSKSHAGSNYKLWEMAAVVREDFNVGQDNMFVAENWVLKDKNKTGYYDGYWMKYNETDPGVKLEIYSMGAGTPRISGSPFSFTRTEEGSRIYTTKVTGLTANTQYGIEILGNNGTYYKNSGEMTSTNAVGGWDYVDRQPTRGTIRTTAAGDYNVQLSCSDKLILAVDFPLAVGDYQVKYSGKDSVGGNTITNASSVIRHIGAVGSKNDTVSFFVVKGDSWTLQLQKCTAVSPSITWANVGSVKTAVDFGSPETGVYNFVVKQDSASGTPVTPSFATMTPIAYTGNYYIRTDAAAGGWEAYKKSMDNRMVFSNYSKQHSQYDYYHCHYSKSGKNVKFCIANDYSGQLSVVKTTDTYVTNEYGNLPGDANVRFMWNSETNVVRRAYLNGSSTTDFLVLAAKNDSVKNTDGSAISKSGDYNQVKFEDKNNWIYQKDVQALEGTHYRLTSNYRFSSEDHIQYFKGSAGDWTPAHTELLIGGTTGGSWQTLRLIYDFKTNHLTAAWLPPTTDITTAKHIEADMLLIRTCQNAAQQLTFNGGSVDKVKTMIGAIELRYDSIVGKVGSFSNTTRAYRELMYYISFPFDVAVSDIYGFGQLNKEWYLQYYDGAERASKGWFKGDGTTTFWKFMTLSDTLKANVGYSLLLDNDYFNTTGTGTVWENKTSGDRIYLYFPSAKELDGSNVIKTGSAALPVPSHECTIDRTFVSENSGRTVNHKFTDSHWNMMGVPLFQNQTSVETEKFIAAISTEDPQELVPFPANKGYFYEWDSLRNTLSVRTTSGYTFKSMHGYMVQFTGTVGFSGSSIQPASPVAARRTKLNRDNYTIELQLLQNNNRVSRTYVELREEACDTFALNEDVYMVYTSQPADLFTLAGNYDVSANVLTENDHIIPVGIDVHKAGTYTFTMPSNFSGSVTLVDNELNTRTNLALSDYEVTLPKGVCEGRFSIEIGIRKTPTSIDVIEDGGSLKDGKAHKFIMNDQMYIIKNGVIYDAQGKRVK